MKKYALLILMAWLCLACTAQAAQLNKIAAVVNGQVITMFDLQKAALPELGRARLNPNDPKQADKVNVVFRKVLDSMIMDILLEQEAKRLSITVSDSEIDQELTKMMKMRRLNRAQFEAELKKQGMSVVILDTAGRLHIDEEMMAELQEIKEAVTVHQTILVVDAMTGQDAVNVASNFNDKIGIDGVIVTKLDGDTRGGAALSIKAVTGKPILYVGMGEKLSDLEQFYPDRMASRILGMGDVLTLIEKAGAEIDEEQAKKTMEKMKKAQFDYEDYLDSMSQMKKMGGLSSIMGMLPGMPGMGNKKMPELDSEENEKKMARMEAMIQSMTVEERRNPDLLNPSRKHRIAKGAGVDIAEVNRMVKQFNETRKMMKKLPGLMGGMGGKKGKFKLPF